jgi:large subunit ribosomal protein L17
MSSHRRRAKHFGRTSKPRRALLRGLMTSLVEHGRIKTTVEKAKELRRHIERLITLGKKGDVATRRVILSRIANKDAMSTIVDDLSKRFQSRPGGYTRIIKIGRRPGDQAEMAFIEFVDYDWKKKAADQDGTTKAEGAEKTDKKKQTSAKKAASSLVASKKKKTQKAKKKARTAARG